ncbi:MAG: putative glycoside hydrolase [Evtepia gabavorous]|uniref:putative glycoside hydrolase n=1 Tax=Evtepia gabavorous TaxID=2211183 RepID=UPI002E79D0CF|nr:putative glycoside hydrolase [Evtepia gabavorous]MEE0067031.1 putative glycoside hydrolase [Evtepia gabavorous]
MRHSSYHTPSLPSRIGRVLLVLLCSAGVLSGGFLLLCGLGVLSPAAISQQVSAWLHPPAASTPASAPAEDLSLPEENDPFQGVFLSLDQLSDAQTLADGYDGVILPMKTADGALGYVSALPLAADAGASSGDPDRNEALRALNDTPGLYTVAQVSCLRDSALVREEPGLSLHRVSGSPWLDESRQGWLDPAQPQVQSYLIGLCRELAQLGFDEILLTDCGFPTQGDLDSLRAVEEKEETLETFCRQLQGALADTPVTLSVMGQRDSVTADPVSGQTTALLATFGRVWTQAEDQEALAAFDPVVLPADT